MKKILTVLLSFVLLVNTINAEEITENENNIVENNLQNTNEVQLQKDNDTKVSDETKEVDEEYDWASIQPTKTTTSEGIEVEGGFINKVNGEYLFYLNYTIPEDYDKDTLTINPEIFEVIAWGQSYQNAPKVMPGQTLRINVTIINNSKYNYNYDKNSFVIYPYTSEELEELNYKKITDEGILFNGEEANEIHQYPRMINNALKDLVKNETKKAYDNDTLDTLLKKLNYNGIEELSKYYVDFYNNYFGYTEENKKENLRDFSVDEQIIILGVNPSKVTEDNNDLIALHFDLLFNNLFGIALGDEVINDSNQEEYSVGEYMRDETKGEEQVTKHYGTLTSESENDMDFIFHFNGPDMKNPYANYRLTGHSHLSFTAETGKVTATYIDDEGNKLTEDIINTGKVNDEYKTNEKEFQYYKLIEIQGNETGIYKSEEQIVTYVYTFVGGTGGDIVEDINFPKTGVSTNNIPEVIFVSSTLLLLITILFKKKFI